MSEMEKILNKQGVYITVTKGNSMNPMLVEGRDKVVIIPPVFPLKKYDIPVYRKEGHYTMHRIIKVTKKGYVICGDNRANLELNVKDSDIIGMLEGVYQNDKYISKDDKEFISYGKRACRTLPLRKIKAYIKAGLNKMRAASPISRHD